MASTSSQPESEAAPARGTRPRNRQALIVAAATDLFHRYGFAEVTMTMIAEQVNVRPSALYRHFANKHTLLAASIRASLAPTASLLADGDRLPIDQLLGQLSTLAMDNRAVGVLWQREARSLPAEEFADVRVELRAVADALAGRLLAERPALTAAHADQLAWSVLAALASLSFHDPVGPLGVGAESLTGLLGAIVAVPVPDETAFRPAPTRQLQVQSRRERLLAAASRLFAAHGYAAVTVDAIGESAGISGPSVYNHFVSKQDILVAVVHRGNEWMWMELSRAFADASDERAAMARLLDAYLTLVVERGELGNVLAGDLGYLPEDVQAQARQSQQEYVREWVALLSAADPGMTTAEARLRIQAAFTIINTTAQTPHLAKAAGSTALLRSVVDAVLGLAEPESTDLHLLRDPVRAP